MSSHAAPHPLHRPLIALVAALLLLGTLLVAPSAHAEEVLEVEPNNSTAAAQVLPLGATVTGALVSDSSCGAACDYYRFSAPGQGRLRLDLRFASTLGTQGQLRVTVADAQGREQYRHYVSAADYDGSTLRDLAMYVDAGVFYVKVAVYSQSALWSTQHYTLTTTVTPGVVETESNDSTATADVIELGRTISGSIFDGVCGSDCDFFRLTTPTTAKLSADLRYSCDLGTGTLYRFRALDNSGNVLADRYLGGADCDGAALRAVQIIAPAGNVYFEVRPYQSSLVRGEEYLLTVSRTDTPAPAVDVQRLAGTDRQGTAVEISKATFAPGVPVTYIATGAKFPDALAAAPAAATQGGPLLLVDRDSMSATVKQELSRLQPATIVVVGSALSISDALLAELRGYAGSGGVQRIGGVDRYDTAEKIVRYAFPAGASTAWIATGEKFPDALSASAAAGSVDAPVILVNGGLATATPQTRRLMTDLGTTTATLAGSALSVSDGIAQSLPAQTTRIGGTDRYDTSERLNTAAFSAAETVYFATGENFPDALAGATAAGYTGSPLFAVRPDCVPQKVLADLTALKASTVILLGGPGTLSEDVARLTPC